MATALGLACSQGGGLRPSTASPTSAIRIQSGEALRRSVHSVDLARAGITTHPGILRCPGGFYPAYGFGEPGRYEVPAPGRTGDLMTAVSMKLECTPHTLVTMLDVARAIANRRSFSVADVESVTVRVPRQHNVISGGTKPFPATFAEAAGHVPYCVAVAMLTRSNLVPSVIEGGLTDEDVRALTARVELVVDDRLTRIFDDDPTSWPAAVDVRWSDGTGASMELRAPETAGWTAADALDHAAAKAEALSEGRAGAAAELGERFARAGTWPDLWARLRVDPLTDARPGRPDGR
jgi:2-methylcitrate dehydratase PrpD